MKRAVLAVCDVEEAYARNFMEYLHARQSPKLPFEIQAFTGSEALLEYARDHRIEILLISEKAVTDAVRSLPVGRMVILSEGADLPGTESCPRVYKYQSSDQVVREVLDLYGAEKLARFAPVRLRSRQKMTGICSPSGFPQRMLFSAALGQIRAERQAVLFVCLDSCCALGDIFAEAGRQTLSDLLYTWRRGGKITVPHLEKALHTVRGLDCILPAEASADLQEQSGAEWICFLEELMGAGNYESLVLDIGCGLRDIPELLGSCDEIWLPSRADVLSAAALSRFENMLREENPEAAGRICRIYPPELNLAAADRHMLEGLCDGELGDFVRKMA